MSITNPDDGRNRRKAIFEVEDDDLEIKSEDESDDEEEQRKSGESDDEEEECLQSGEADDESDSDGEESEGSSQSENLKVKHLTKDNESDKPTHSDLDETRLSTKGNKRQIFDHDDSNEDIESDVGEHVDRSIKKKKLPVEAETVR